MDDPQKKTVNGKEHHWRPNQLAWVCHLPCDNAREKASNHREASQLFLFHLVTVRGLSRSSFRVLSKPLSNMMRRARTISHDGARGSGGATSCVARLTSHALFWMFLASATAGRHALHFHDHSLHIFNQTRHTTSRSNISVSALFQFVDCHLSITSTLEHFANAIEFGIASLDTQTARKHERVSISASLRAWHVLRCAQPMLQPTLKQAGHSLTPTQFQFESKLRCGASTSNDLKMFRRSAHTHCWRENQGHHRTRHQGQHDERHHCLKSAG